jgi:hypothetical protein
MAFQTKIVAPASGTDRPTEVDGPLWLEEPPPCGPLAWRDVSLSPGYIDLAAHIRAADLLDWHSRDRHLAFEGVFAYEGWRPIMDSKVETLEDLLRAASTDALFTLVQYEWESGLN